MASLQRNQRLIVDETALKWSMIALRLTVLSDTMVSYLLLPSYAVIVDEGAHPDSFPSTAPFDFSTATYFIPMMQLVGVAISSSFTGTASDKLGRKPVIIFCLVGSMIGCIVKWFCRKSFWAFSISHLFAGLLSGSTPVSLAYVSDAFESRAVKDKETGKTIAFYVLGMSLGGLLAVLMYPQGLFAPLWAGAGLMVFVLIFNLKFLIEPGNLKVMSTLDQPDVDEEETEVLNNTADGDVPKQSDISESIDKGTMSIIILGSVADIFGSKSLFPMCLSPLAYQIFYKNFVDKDLTPIISVNGFQWLGVFLGALVMPSAFMSPRVFQRIGLASGCVVGNILTGLLTMALLLVANVKPATNLTFWFFAVLLYVGFPFTVLSQLSTSPMLDRLAPPNQRGFVQGIYTTFYNLAGAISPWLLGLLADGTSTNIMIWVGVGISFVAALVNFPLVFQEKFGPPKKKEVPMINLFDESGMTEADEASWEEKMNEGEFIPAKVLNEINYKRIQQQKPLLIPPVGTYEEDKDRLAEIRKQAKDEFTYLSHRSHVLLSKMNDPEMPKIAENISYAYNTLESNHEEIGQWFGEYMRDNGYIGPQSAQAIKLMITKAFPKLYPGGQMNVDNFEQVLVNTERVFNHYIGGEIRAKEKYGLMSMFKLNGRRF